jgi:hypothetical protein
MLEPAESIWGSDLKNTNLDVGDNRMTAEPRMS